MRLRPRGAGTSPAASPALSRSPHGASHPLRPPPHPSPPPWRWTWRTRTRSAGLKWRRLRPWRSPSWSRRCENSLLQKKKKLINVPTFWSFILSKIMIFNIYSWNYRGTIFTMHQHLFSFRIISFFFNNIFFHTYFWIKIFWASICPLCTYSATTCLLESKNRSKRYFSIQFSKCKIKKYGRFRFFFFLTGFYTFTEWSHLNSQLIFVDQSGLFLFILSIIIN